MIVDFCKLELDAQTEQNLYEFCLDNRLGLANSVHHYELQPKDFKFHLTIMYSKTLSEEFEDKTLLFGPHVLKPTEFAMFGPDNDMLVLKIDPDGVLTDLHEHYVHRYGHVSDFPMFRPHITIRGSDITAQKRIGKLPLPDFDLVATTLVHKKKLV